MGGGRGRGGVVGGEREEGEEGGGTVCYIMDVFKER